MFCCPRCRSRLGRTIGGVSLDDGFVYLRYKRCQECGFRFRTKEELSSKYKKILLLGGTEDERKKD